MLAEIGSKYGKSAAQVALRWLTQCGIIGILGSHQVPDLPVKAGEAVLAMGEKQISFEPSGPKLKLLTTHL